MPEINEPIDAFVTVPVVAIKFVDVIPVDRSVDIVAFELAKFVDNKGLVEKNDGVYISPLVFKFLAIATPPSVTKEPVVILNELLDPLNSRLLFILSTSPAPAMRDIVVPAVRFVKI